MLQQQSRIALGVMLFVLLKEATGRAAFVGKTQATSWPRSAQARTSKTRAAVSLSSVWSNSTLLGLPNQESTLPLFHEEQRRVAKTKPKTNQFKVFCDLDGVLVDFAHGVTQAYQLEASSENMPVMTSQNIDAMPRSELWDRVQTADAFFQHLPWCSGGKRLWKAIAPLKPDILTGVPSYCHTSPRVQKFAWCERELSGPLKFHHIDKAGRLRMHYRVNGAAAAAGRGHRPTEATSQTSSEWNCRVITCWSERKHHESGPGRVLIDDRIDLKTAWEAAGGIFIHHNGNTDRTLRQLMSHGILEDDTDAWQGALLRP